ncbi:rRNA processing protein [Sorochytrium milnesiophthora]
MHTLYTCISGGDQSSRAQKVKLKLGKKLVADSHTDVSFKSRAINVPGQSILLEKDGEATNKRNMTLGQLTTQLKHYSASIRKEAMVGLAQLLDMHPYVLRLHLGTVLDALLKVIIDEDNDVRKQLLVVMEQSVLPQLSREQLSPFTNSFVDYACSGITHIFEDVRLHALRLVDLWGRQAAALLVPYASRLLPGYGRLLGAPELGAAASVLGSNSAQSQVASAKNRRVVLQSLASFLEVTLSVNTTARNERSTPFVDYLRPPPFSLYSAKHDALQSRSGDQVAFSFNVFSSRHVLLLLQSLAKVLNDFWMEEAPTAITPARVAGGPALDTCAAVMRITRVLWHNIANGGTGAFSSADDWKWLDTYMRSVDRHVLLHFPFGRQSSDQRDRQVETTLQELNADCARFLASVLRVLRDRTSAGEEAHAVTRTRWQSALHTYLLDVFSVRAQQPSISATHLAQVATSVESCLRGTQRDSPADACALLVAICKWNESMGSSHRTKRPATEFLIRLIEENERLTGGEQGPLAQPHVCDQVNVLALAAADDQLRQAIVRLAISLTRYLWELKTSAPDLTAHILSFLRRMLLCRSGASTVFTDTVVANVQKGLAMFLYIETKKGTFVGPFRQFDEQTQLLALDTVYALDTLSDEMSRALLNCCLLPSANPVVVQRAVMLVRHRCALSEAVGLMLTLLVGALRQDLASMQAVPAAHKLVDVVDASAPGGADYLQRRLAIADDVSTAMVQHVDSTSALLQAAGPALQNVLNLARVPVLTVVGVARFMMAMLHDGCDGAADLLAQCVALLSAERMELAPPTKSHIDEHVYRPLVQLKQHQLAAILSRLPQHSSNAATLAPLLETLLVQPQVREQDALRTGILAAMPSVASLVLAPASV